jgi:hypothetical protein
MTGIHEPSSGQRPNVLVHAEKVFRIVLLLELLEAPIVRSVRGGDWFTGLIVTQVIHIAGGGEERFHLRKCLARPGKVKEHGSDWIGGRRLRSEHSRHREDNRVQGALAELVLLRLLQRGFCVTGGGTERWRFHWFPGQFPRYPLDDLGSPGNSATAALL